MRLNELVAAPHLGVRVILGDDAELARPIRWTYFTEARNPAPVSSRGLLALSGLMWHGEPADSDTFVAALARAGTAGLAASERRGAIPDDVVAACRANRLPLLAVASGVSLSDVADHISAHSPDGAIGRLATTLVGQRQQLSDVVAGRFLGVALLDFSRETGLPCWIASSTGRRVATSSAPLTEAELDELTVVAMSRPRLPAFVSTDAGGFTVVDGRTKRRPR